MENNLIFRQLTEHDEIDQNQLVQLSELIYDTDPYIYPCIFQSKADALCLLPKVFRQNDDAMFRLSNCYIAEYSGAIVGMILWHKGSLQWEPQPLLEQAAAAGIPLSVHLPLVHAQYFGSYQNIPDNIISLVNVCVDRHCRNQGIGQRLLQAFIAEHSEEPMELYVLADNKPAQKVYGSNGFKTTRLMQGFSHDNRTLPCLQMKKF